VTLLLVTLINFEKSALNFYNLLGLYDKADIAICSISTPVAQLKIPQHEKRIDHNNQLTNLKIYFV
jgi:hypothetical protein